MRVKDLGTRPAPVSMREVFSRVLRGYAPVILVHRREIPYWREHGWTRNGNHYTGSYQTRHAAFQGRIEEEWSGRHKFYLFHPSAQIQRHSHWTCFVPQGKDWYLVHMARRPMDVSSGIITIERLITEAYES
jgi:hypothetical protein